MCKIKERGSRRIVRMCIKEMFKERVEKKVVEIDKEIFELCVKFIV